MVILLATINGLSAKTSAYPSQNTGEEDLPFFIFSNLLLVGAQADNQEGYFILDTGALGSFVEPGDSIRIRGLDKRVLWVRTVLLKDLAIANLSYSYLKIAFADLSCLNNHFAGMNPDGILELDLLSQHKTTINFKRKEIYIWLPEGAHPQLVLNKPGNDRNLRN